MKDDSVLSCEFNKEKRAAYPKTVPSKIDTLKKDVGAE